MRNIDFWSANRVRETFLEFFRAKEHAIVPSAPMVVKDDPTLMFTNAGMNQFKDIFLGNSPAINKRVADSQKCLRVSGKHNDLEQVGHDTYHHTMFEMLGNWSFGDYFKKEAIEWAWELLIGVYKLPKERIYVTIFEGDSKDGVERDEEAFEMWSKLLPKEQIILGNKEDNFWEMGEVGPCGPCSEIHFDLRDDKARAQVSGATLVNADHPHVIEIWNLVFMQFDRKSNGSLIPLPAQHVDTGMGFERLCMILQGKQSNYDTDVFQPMILTISKLAGQEYGKQEQADIAMRVIADHMRAIAFAIADGQLPSNVRAGYVIRRILRRAVRYGYTYLDFKEPFMYNLVECLVSAMGEQFPELKAQKTLIQRVIMEEESSFLNTLSTGINLLDNTIERVKKEGKEIISGRDAFTLYDTYGFPFDLTELIARENGMTVDQAGFESELEQQKNRSRSDASVQTDDWVEVMPIEESVFVGYDTLESDIRIARYRKVERKGKSFYHVVFDKTPFYGNSGGQVGDSGYIEHDGVKSQITNTIKENTLTIHIMNNLPAVLDVEFRGVVNTERRQSIANNHTATHLLHDALREILGKHVEQKGSLVEEKHLRFDFSHFEKVSSEELKSVEQLVNKRIRENNPMIERRNSSVDEAREEGALMLFGEKYGDRVRVIRFGDSIELCGGTHAARTGDVGLFKILTESAISAGVRRIEAFTGEAAEEYVYKLEGTLLDIQKFVNNPSVLQAVNKLLEDNEELSKRVEEYRQKSIDEMINFLSEKFSEEDGIVWIVNKMEASPDVIKDVAFALKQRIPNMVFIIGAVVDGKPSISIMLGDGVMKSGVNASVIIREVAKEIDGGGGGQPFFATAGGKNAAGLDKAMIKAREMVKKVVE